MKTGSCDRHGKRVPFIQTGPHGSWVCQACEYEQQTGKDPKTVLWLLVRR